MLHLIPVLDDKQTLLAQRHAWLCELFACRHVKRKYRPLDFEELLSASHFGLMRAAALFDQTSDERGFQSFAIEWMRYFALDDQRRKIRRRQQEQRCDQDILEEYEERPEGCDRLEQDALVDRILRHIATLKPTKQMILKLRLQGLSGSEIARRLGCCRSYTSLVLREEFSKLGDLAARLPQIFNGGQHETPVRDRQPERLPVSVRTHPDQEGDSQPASATRTGT